MSGVEERENKGQDQQENKNSTPKKRRKSTIPELNEPPKRSRLTTKVNSASESIGNASVESANVSEGEVDRRPARDRAAYMRNYRSRNSASTNVGESIEPLPTEREVDRRPARDRAAYMRNYRSRNSGTSTNVSESIQPLPSEREVDRRPARDRSAYMRNYRSRNNATSTNVGESAADIVSAARAEAYRRGPDPSINIRPNYDPLLVTKNPQKGELKDFEQNPKTALLAFAVNSGLERYPNLNSIDQTSNDLGPSTDELTSSNANRGNLEDENAIPNTEDNLNEATPERENEPEILHLMEQIKLETLQIEEVQEKIFLDFRKAWNSKANLTACASCGIRAFQLGNIEYKNYAIEKLEILKYSTEQTAILFEIPERFRKAISYFQHGGFYFHLHPEFVTVNEENVTEAAICQTCETAIKKGTIPKFSVAAGVDFGDPRRVGLPELTLTEQYTIALSCPYVTILKLIGTSNSQRQSAKRGHSITYFHNAPQETASVLQSLPRVTGITNFLSISFLGSQQNWEAFQPSIGRSVPQLQVRPHVVYQWLNVLKAINPLYKDIEIIDNEERTMALRNIPFDLIENATIMENSVHQQMEEVIEMRTASFGGTISDLNQQAEPEVDEVQSVSISDVFVTNTSYVDTGPMNPLSAVCLAMENTIIESTYEKDPNDGTQDEDHNENVLDDDQLEHDLENTSNEGPPRVNVTRSREPINEFSSNNRIILSSFPSLFMLGRGISNKATLPTNVIRHMMFQFNCRIASCHRFIFLLFDQLQRHAVARIVSARVKSDPVSMEKLGKLVRDPTFLRRLRAAAKNPNSEDARKILKIFSPHIALSSSKVPFSKQASKAGMAKLKALTVYHGMPGLFLTISPDDAHDPNRIRMSLPQENNMDFPARDAEDFIEALKSNQT